MIKIEECKNRLRKLEEKRDRLSEKMLNNMAAHTPIRCDNCGHLVDSNNPHLLHYDGTDHYHCY